MGERGEQNIFNVWVHHWFIKHWDVFSLVEFYYFIPFVAVSNVPCWCFWSHGKIYNPVLCLVYLLNIHYPASSNFFPYKIFLESVRNELFCIDFTILMGDGTPCVFQKTSLVASIEAFSFWSVTGVSSSLTHSMHVSQVKQGLNIVIGCWDGQDDFFTLSHPWVIFISFWLQWAVALDLRRLLTYELRWSQWHQPWRREEECLCDLFIWAGGRLLKSTQNWGVLLPFAEVRFYAQAALQYCTPFHIRKISLQLGALCASR